MRAMYLGMILTGALLTGGCVTPYQPNAYAGGFDQTRVAEDAYIVKFYGNGFTSPQRVRDLALLRAAEIGRKLNFTHFVVVGTQDLAALQSVNVGTTTTTTGTVTATGNVATYSGTTTTLPGVINVAKPAIELGIKYFEGPPQGRFLEVLEVRRVYSDMANKYRVPSGQ